MKRTYKNLIKVFYYLIILVITLNITISSLKDLNNIKINFLFISCSIIIYLIYKVISAFIWHYITCTFSCNVSLLKSLYIWIYSQKGKFAPGKLFYMVDRVYLYKEELVLNKNIYFCFIIEDLFNSLSALFVFIFIMPFVNFNIYDDNIFGFIIIAGIVLFIFNPYFLKKYFNIVLKILKKNELNIKFDFKRLLVIFLMFIVNHFVLVTGFFVLVKSVQPISLNNYFYIVAVYSLALCIGVINFFIPLGVGIRESILVFLLNSLFSLANSLVISIIARLWALLGKILLVIFAIIFKGIKIKMYKKNYS